MKHSFKNVLVPFDFSKAALNAVHTAIAICKRHDATLHLLHVMSPEYFYPIGGMQAPILPLADEILSSEIDNLTTYASSIQRNHEITCITHSEVGGFTSSICKFADQKVCDLIVIGTGASVNAFGLLGGNAAFKVLRATDCPVLTIPENRKVNVFKRVLFPVRPVLHAAHKYGFSNAIFQKNKSKVYVIGALQTDDAAKYNSVRNMVGTVEHDLDNDNIRYNSEYHFSKNIGQHLLDTCAKISADLIVITASTKRSFQELFCKNYTQRLMETNTAAVLSIKPSISVENYALDVITSKSAI